MAHHYFGNYETALFLLHYLIAEVIINGRSFIQYADMFRVKRLVVSFLQRGADPLRQGVIEPEIVHHA